MKLLSNTFGVLLCIVALLHSSVNLAQVIKPEVMLATVYQLPRSTSSKWLSEYWLSEKLDGVRGYWTGSQLLTKQGRLIDVPAGFVDHWPTLPMDGELWIARQQFDKVSAIVRRKKSDLLAWKNVRFMVFDLPSHTGVFTERISDMKRLVVAHSPTLGLIKQQRMQSLGALNQYLDTVVETGGEGLMLHHQDSRYYAGRSKRLMKLKKHYDAEATVIAHYKGKGKYAGKMGSLMVRMADGLTFKIGSGFSDEQRRNPPGIGSIITFKYYAKTTKGVPRFASFMRIRLEGTK